MKYVKLKKNSNLNYMKIFKIKVFIKEFNDKNLTQWSVKQPQNISKTHPEFIFKL